MLAFPTRHLIVLFGALIMLAACSSPPSNDTAPATGQEQAVKYAQCIRAHGVPDFPDPDAQGRLRGVGHERQGNPRYSAAFEACRAKLPGGGGHQ
jgi:hypothetical protein